VPSRLCLCRAIRWSIFTASCLISSTVSTSSLTLNQARKRCKNRNTKKQLAPHHLGTAPSSPSGKQSWITFVLRAAMHVEVVPLLLNFLGPETRLMFTNHLAALSAQKIGSVRWQLRALTHVQCLGLLIWKHQSKSYIFIQDLLALD
jgi:hypothetical protein